LILPHGPPGGKTARVAIIAPGLTRVAWGQVLQQETVIRDLKWFRFCTVSKGQSVESFVLRRTAARLARAAMG
jgi:hypothetical protein